MKLVVGTYEGSLIGWESDYEADASGRTLSLAYAFSAHDASVKALAIDGRGGTTLVTGSSDETIKVYSLRTRREIGSLLEHRDAVTALDFFGGDSLLSGDHAGAICIWRTSDWTNLHTMTGHKGAVHSIAVHPSGRLALSVAADKCLRLWDLTKGRPALTAPLGAEARVVRWSADGAFYALMFDDAVRVCDGATGATRATLASPAGARLLDMVLLEGAAAGAAGGCVVVAGCEGGDAQLWDAGGAWSAAVATGHARRVRCVAVIDAIAPAAPRPDGAASAAAVAAAAAGAAVHRGAAPAAASSGGPLGAALPPKPSAAVVLPDSGPFLATIGSDCVVKLWGVSALLAAARAAATAAATAAGGPAPQGARVDGSGSGGGGSGVAGGLAPVASLSWGAGARPTAMVAARGGGASAPAAATAAAGAHHGAATAAAATAAAAPSLSAAGPTAGKGKQQQRRRKGGSGGGGPSRGTSGEASATRPAAAAPGPAGAALVAPAAAAAPAPARPPNKRPASQRDARGADAPSAAPAREPTRKAVRFQ